MDFEEQEEEAETPERGEANDVVAVVEVELEQVEEAEANDGGGSSRSSCPSVVQNTPVTLRDEAGLGQEMDRHCGTDYARNTS